MKFYRLRLPLMKRSAIAIASLIVCCSVVAGGAVPTAHDIYNIDLGARAKLFDGIGAVSAGGTTRLLRDYTTPQRTAILDWLFSPRVGAALHHLKVEIGGDTFTGVGTEPSHQRAAGEVPALRGYEGWFMKEAVARNPNITLSGLPWGFPAWTGPPLSASTAAYVTSWLQAASDAGLSVSYLGIWNEETWTADYVKRLRSLLDAAGHRSVGIVLADLFEDSSAGGDIAEALRIDPALRSAVAAVGVHYPVGSISNPNLSTLTPPVKLWASEDASTVDTSEGAGCWARIINWNYLIGNYSSTLMWDPVSAFYDGLRWFGDSLINAQSPWTGHFDVSPVLWATAHTTHFAQPGWWLLRAGAGSGFLRGGGSFVTYVGVAGAESTLHLTVVIETMTRNHSRCIRSNPRTAWTVAASQHVALKLSASTAAEASALRHRPFVAMVSHIFGANVSYFQRWPEALRPVETEANSGHFMLELPFELVPDSIVTISSWDDGHQRARVPDSPDIAPFPVPYSDHFDNYPEDGTLPRYFSDQAGSFAVRTFDGDAGERLGLRTPIRNASGGFLLQEVTASPSLAGTGWHNQDAAWPLSIVGDWAMRDYGVSVDVALPPTDASVVVGARVGGLRTSRGCGTDEGSARETSCIEAYASTWYDFGYFLVVNSSHWSFRAGSEQILVGRLPDRGKSVLNGSADGLRWRRLELSVHGDLFVGSFDGYVLFRTPDARWPNGFAALGSSWDEVAFDAFQLQRASPATEESVILS
eukprot:TRINITY_DN14444_c0_g1_i1.p1 TRINITY_DN14444_c0_g1~~TRINITY_DN14444_c0_g1_i1.p1  ORF type:complete len:756 (+),score=135.35 TRINITY_DN14444_c0_g1_i1:59-2326(+)